MAKPYRAVTGSVYDVDPEGNGVDITIETWEDADGRIISDNFEAPITADDVAKTDWKNFKELSDGDDFELSVTAEWLTQYV